MPASFDEDELFVWLECTYIRCVTCYVTGSEMEISAACLCSLALKVNTEQFQFAWKSLLHLQ